MQDLPRIQIEATDHDEQHEELLTKARALGGDVVRVEVEYPREREAGSSWDESGGAVEVDFTADPPTVATLPPYEEAAQ